MLRGDFLTIMTKNIRNIVTVLRTTVKTADVSTFITTEAVSYGDEKGEAKRHVGGSEGAIRVGGVLFIMKTINSILPVGHSISITTKGLYVILADAFPT